MLRHCWRGDAGAANPPAAYCPRRRQWQRHCWRDRRGLEGRGMRGGGAPTTADFAPSPRTKTTTTSGGSTITNAADLGGGRRRPCLGNSRRTSSVGEEEEEEEDFCGAHDCGVIVPVDRVCVVSGPSGSDGFFAARVCGAACGWCGRSKKPKSSRPARGRLTVAQLLLLDSDFCGCWLFLFRPLLLSRSDDARRWSWLWCRSRTRTTDDDSQEERGQKTREVPRARDEEEQVRKRNV